MKMTEQNSADNIIKEGGLQIRCDGLGICKTYSKEELAPYVKNGSMKLEDLKEVEKFLIKFDFREGVEIVFIYKPTEEESLAWILIPKQKMLREVYNDDGTVEIKWMPIENIGYFNIVLKIKPKERKKKSFIVPLYLKEVLAKTDRGNTSSDDFHSIMNRLEKIGIDVYNRHNPSMIPQDVDKRATANLFEELNTTRQGIKRLKKILYNISRNPNQEFIDETVVEKFSDIDDIDPDTICDIFAQNCDIVKIPKGSIMTGLQELFVDDNGDSYPPDVIFVDRPKKTFDIPENRLLKIRLSQLLVRIDVIKAKLENMIYEKGLKKEDIKVIEQYIDICDKIRKDVLKMKMYHFLNDVKERGDISPIVFQRGTNYMRFDNIYKGFTKRPIFKNTSSYLSIPIDRTWLVYEKLAVMELFNILDSLLGWDSNPHALEYNKLGFSFELRTGAKKSLIDISRNYNGRLIEISLYYQRKYRTYYYRKDRKKYEYLKPDIVMEIRINKKLYKIITFDVKYMSILEGDPNYPDNPIHALYKYKGGITVKDPITGDHVEISRDVCIIYIGDTDISYLSERTKTGAFGGIGLFVKDGDIYIDDLKDVILNFINVNIEI